MTSNQSSQNTVAAPAKDNNAKADAPDPCKLLTKEEAAAILGEPIRDPQPGSISDTKYCDYKAVKLYGGIMPASVHIALTPMKRNTWEIGKQSTMKSNPKETKQVDGLGEDAYYEGESLVIFDKDLFITVEVAKNFDKPDHHKVIMDAAKQVAQKIVPRL